jgi:hypothetical protein
MVEGEARAAIARRAGLEPKRLLAIAESELEPQTVSKKALRKPDIHLLRTRVVSNVDGEQLPIIEIETQAPDAARARALANATVTGLSDYLETRAAAGEEVDPRRRLRVSGLGTAQATVSTRGPGRMLALGAAAFVFLAGCGAILLVSALTRGWRQAEAEERSAVEHFAGEDFSAGEDFTVADLDLDLAPLSLALDKPDRDAEASAKSA